MDGNGNRKLPSNQRDELQKLADDVANAAETALTAADRLTTTLVHATHKDADATMEATDEREDQIQDAATDLLIAGAMLQTHGWWLPDNIEGLVTIIKNASRSTLNERNEGVAQLVLDHCNWLRHTKRQVDREAENRS